MNDSRLIRLRTETVTESCPVWDRVITLANEAFHLGDQLAPEELVRLEEKPGFDFLALMEENRFVGFLVALTHRDVTYLFLLAIEEKYRSKGYGKEAISLLKRMYPENSQILDIEMPDPFAENRTQREKCRSFFLKNGYRETGVFHNYLGVDYEILCTDKSFDLRRFRELSEVFWVDGFYPRYFSKKEEIFL